MNEPTMPEVTASEPTPPVVSKATQRHAVIEVMNGITFAVTLIVFSILFATIGQTVYGS